MHKLNIVAFLKQILKYLNILKADIFIQFLILEEIKIFNNIRIFIMRENVIYFIDTSLYEVLNKFQMSNAYKYFSVTFFCIVFKGKYIVHN